VAEDIKKVERRVAKDEKEMQEDKQKLPKGKQEVALLTTLSKA
jgi:hypothetical protein